MLRYGIGLDIGIRSIGWAVLSLNQKDEPNGIVDLGVGIFDKAEILNTGESLAKPRRDARSQRRRTRRRGHRIERVENLLANRGLINIEKFKQRYYMKNLPDIYQLRYRALDEIISNDELGQILVYMAKHRGFKSNRKSEMKDSETGKLLTGIKENENIMEEKGYRTVGEMIYLDDKFKIKSYGKGNEYSISARNKEGDYSHCLSRDLLVQEVQYIFNAQRALGNFVADKELEKEYLEILLSQRSFDMGPGNMPDGRPSPYAGNLIENMVGKCSLEKNEKRAAKATYTAERFVLLQTINHTYVSDQAGNIRSLSEEEKSKIVELAYKKDSVSYKDIRTYINLGENEYFKGLDYEDGEKCEKKKFVELKYWTDIKKIFSLKSQDVTDEIILQLDTIGMILTCFKSDQIRKEKLAELNIKDEIVQKLIGLEYSKFNHISIKAMKKLLPYLEQGFIYSEACEKAGYGFEEENGVKLDKKIKGKYLIDTLNEITNPVVRRAVSQSIKQLNAIIDAYGSPVFIRIELAREMSKNFKERKKIEKHQEENEKKNNEAVEQIRSYGIAYPKGQDIVKFKLWQEQDGYDLYTGKQISIEDLFADNKYQVDHILPYSRSFDDSYNNKVVVSAKANQEKGNRTPYEWLSGGGNSYNMTWDEFQILVNNRIHSFRKRQYFLKEHYGREEEKAFKERNLNDTRYITTVVMKLIRNHLIFEDYTDTNKKQHIFSVNGTVTAYMRKRWGLEKSRKTDRHHAQDAVVIACTTPGMIHTITRYIKGRELRYANNSKILDEETGEIFSPRDYSREEWDKLFGKTFPEPWVHFREELKMRMSTNPEKMLEELLKKGYEINKDYLRVHANNDELLQKIGLSTGSISPFFVSRTPNGKVTGPAHEETIASPKIFKEQGKVVQKKALEKLQLRDNKIVCKGGEYYNPQDDRLLYEALVKRLKTYDGNAAKAFAEPFYKPKSDGSDGPRVKKVKMAITQKSGGVYINGGKGICGNGRMVRIDIYKENEKFYMVPVYTADVIKNELPNRAAVANKNIFEWKIMAEENFLFSLYHDDLVYIQQKDGYEMLGYYKNADTFSVNITIKSDDGSKKIRKGIQNLLKMEKYEVDRLGNLKKSATTKKRQGFAKH